MLLEYEVLNINPESEEDKKIAEFAKEVESYINSKDKFINKDTTIDAMVKYSETTNGNSEISVITVYRINQEIIEKIPDGIQFDCPVLESNSNQLELF